MPVSPSDDAVREMVRRCAPDWTVRDHEPSDFGTDFVCFVTCETPNGVREVVLKATTADFVEPEIARAEPRLYELVREQTDIPVPEVYGFVDDHDDLPTPFYLMERLPGENVEGRPDALPAAARDRVVREAGTNLATLHDLGPLPKFGRVGVEDGDLAVLDWDHAIDDFADHVRADAEETLDALEDGTYFPEKAIEPNRFVDLVPALRERVAEELAALDEPGEPTYCHWDYRYGNLLVDPETGATEGVLDWANLTAAPATHNLAKVEAHLVADTDREPRQRELRNLFRTAYAEARPGWTFDPATEERMETYQLVARLGAMAYLPLWHEEKGEVGRREVEKRHRAAFGF